MLDLAVEYIKDLQKQVQVIFFSSGKKKDFTKLSHGHIYNLFPVNLKFFPFGSFIHMGFSDTYG